jgi:hypothetical protein
MKHEEEKIINADTLRDFSESLLLLNGVITETQLWEGEAEVNCLVFLEKSYKLGDNSLNMIVTNGFDKLY